MSEADIKKRNQVRRIKKQIELTTEKLLIELEVLQLLDGMEYLEQSRDIRMKFKKLY